MNRVGVPCVCFSFFWRIGCAIEDLGNGFGFPGSRSVVAVYMCAIEMWVVCFTTDFTDTGPYLLLPSFTSSSSFLERAGRVWRGRLWLVYWCVL